MRVLKRVWKKKLVFGEFFVVQGKGQPRKNRLGALGSGPKARISWFCGAQGGFGDPTPQKKRPRHRIPESF